MDINIHDTADRDVVLIELEGQLDTALSPRLEEVLAQYGQENDKPVVIDLQEVSVITADGIRVLLNAYMARTQASLLQLINPNNEVKQLLVTVGLEGLIVDLT